MWIYNDYLIDKIELKNFAQETAELYLYDIENFNTPQMPLDAFFENFGHYDGDLSDIADGVIFEYLHYYNEYKNNPDLIRKYVEMY